MRVRFSVRKLCVLSVLAALSVVWMLFVRFPIFPMAPYLEFDAGDIAIVTGAFLYGPWAGLMLTVVTSVAQGFIVSASSGIWGVLMHIIATGMFCVVSAAVYQRRRSVASALLGLLLGVVSATLLMIPLNLLITPLYAPAMDISTVAGLLLPAIIPFNLIKFSINAALSFLLWRSAKTMLEHFFGKNEVM